MKSLRQGTNEYLEYRWRLGFKLQNEKFLLASFASFMEINRAKHITIKLALAFATMNPESQPITCAKRLRAIRQFAIYWSAIDSKTEIPPKNLLSNSYRRNAPYIYTDAEIIQLLEYSEASNNTFNQHAYFVLFGLLAITGMRLAEALALNCEDVDLQNGIITIRHSKFRKSRHIPIHKSTVEVLKKFSGYRNRYFPHPVSSYFLVNYRGKQLCRRNVQYVFHDRLIETGIAKPEKHCNPRIMDLRHTFAVKTLLRWYKRGVTSIDCHIYLLSTYLGHVKPTHTYWYLTVTPELLKLIVSRCEKHKRKRKS
jgi:integrase/recombinase XerD